MMNAIESMSNEVKILTIAAQLKANSTFGQMKQLYRGEYKEIVHGFNKTLDAMMGPMNEASEVLEKIAGKDMTVRDER